MSHISSELPRYEDLIAEPPQQSLYIDGDGDGNPEVSFVNRAKNNVYQTRADRDAAENAFKMNQRERVKNERALLSKYKTLVARRNAREGDLMRREYAALIPSWTGNTQVDAIAASNGEVFATTGNAQQDEDMGLDGGDEAIERIEAQLEQGDLALADVMLQIRAEDTAENPTTEEPDGAKTSTDPDDTDATFAPETTFPALLTAAFAGTGGCAGDGSCYSQCQEADRINREKCNLLRKNVACALRDAGCPSIIQAINASACAEVVPTDAATDDAVAPCNEEVMEEVSVSIPIPEVVTTDCAEEEEEKIIEYGHLNDGCEEEEEEIIEYGHYIEDEECSSYY